MASLLAEILELSAMAFRAEGIDAKASLRAGPDPVSELVIRGPDGGWTKALEIRLAPGENTTTVTVEIVDGVSRMKTRIGTATIDPEDLASVALAFARAGTSRLVRDLRAGRAAAGTPAASA
ncbi:MAG TPA: hypothetical protein VF494_05435 [Candidatus Limnocylindrales bacterium]